MEKVNSGNGANDNMTTDEDSIERKRVLNLIYANDYSSLKDALKQPFNKNLNWLERHAKTDLDDRITPLSCAAFLGRVHIVQLLLENPLLDMNQATEESGFTPLSAACAAGHFEVVRLLVENGADVNLANSLGQTPLIFCFTRMTETTNVYENKQICLKIAETLLEHGADIDHIVAGRTLLQSFCAIQLPLDPIQKQMNLDVVKFLLEHGADRNTKSGGQTPFELSMNHCSKDEIHKMLRNTK